MMLGTVLLFLAGCVTAALDGSGKTCTARPNCTFAQNVIFQPDSKHGVSYPRQTQLQDGTLLATAAYSGDNPPFSPSLPAQTEVLRGRGAPT